MLKTNHKATSGYQYIFTYKNKDLQSQREILQITRIEFKISNNLIISVLKNIDSNY